jgi:hypothetical protein
MSRRVRRSAVVTLVLGLAGWLAASSAQASSSVVPSITVTGFGGFQQGTRLCNYGGAAFITETDSGFSANQSDGYTLSVQGVGVVSKPLCENGPLPAGPGQQYGVVGNGTVYSVPAGTPVTAEIRSYNAQNCFGPPTFTGRITFTCDTGTVLNITNFAGGGASCTSGPNTLCLSNNRFAVSATYAAPSGASGMAQVVPLTGGDTGYLWFFNAANVEAVIKVIDGCTLNNEFWVFAGGLTNVNTVISVTDTVTGITKKYTNPQNTAFKPVQDTGAFADCQAGGAGGAELGAAPAADGSEAPAAAPAAADGMEQAAARVAAGVNGEVAALAAGADPRGVAGTGVPELTSGTSLLLSNNRFKVDVTWHTSDGKKGTGNPVALTGDTGYFWFFNSSNVEMVIKVVDGCGFGGHYWVFAGGLTNVRTTITVTDTMTGKFRTYINPQGVPFQPIQDTSAFSQCP